MMYPIALHKRIAGQMTSKLFSKVLGIWGSAQVLRCSGVQLEWEVEAEGVLSARYQSLPRHLGPDEAPHKSNTRGVHGFG